MHKNQVRVYFWVYEGERVMVEDNNFLGKFWLSGIFAPIVVASFRVVFELDAHLEIVNKEAMLVFNVS